MPCDTTPPPSPIENVINDGNDEDLDDSMYDFIDDIDELEINEDIHEDVSVRTFEGHKEAIFCCNFDRTGQYIVTGGQDDKAIVWNVVDASIKFECTGHNETVIAANFSSDSTYVSTADMNGLVQVWNVEDGKLCWSFETFEITWTEWLKGANILIAGSVDGNCWKWSIPDGDTKMFEHSRTSCTFGRISHNDKKLATGYSDGTLKFWDIPDTTLLTTLTGSVGHKAPVTSIRYNVDDSLILTGSEDGAAKLIKSSDFKVLWTVEGCDSSHHEHEHPASVEDVGFCHTLPYIVTGTNCGLICIWDMNTKTQRAVILVHNSIVKMICDEFAPIMYAAIDDGTLQAFDLRTGDPVRVWHGHKKAIFDLAISSDRSLLLTASDDQMCKMFERGIF